MIYICRIIAKKIIDPQNCNFYSMHNDWKHITICNNMEFPWMFLCIICFKYQYQEARFLIYFMHNVILWPKKLAVHPSVIKKKDMYSPILRKGTLSILNIKINFWLLFHKYTACIHVLTFILNLPLPCSDPPPVSRHKHSVTTQFLKSEKLTLLKIKHCFHDDCDAQNMSRNWSM